MLDVAFTLEGEWENWEDIPYSEIIKALKKRVSYLEEHKEIEAFGYSDTYEVEDGLMSKTKCRD